MTDFNSQESSTEDGRPVELYIFTLGGTEYLYTNSDSETIVNAKTYSPEAISRTNVEVTPDIGRITLSVEMPFDNEFAQLFVNASIPGTQGTLKIIQFHRTDTTDQEVIVFDGVVATVAFSQNLERATINCRPVLSAGDRPFSRHTYQGLCNNMLFDNNCTLSQAAFTDTGTVSVVVDNTITVTGLPAGNLVSDYYVGGQIKLGTEFRTILTQASNVFTIFLPFRETLLGASVGVIAGCKHRILEDCQNKFSNEENFGGWPYVPTRDIFRNGLGT